MSRPLVLLLLGGLLWALGGCQGQAAPTAEGTLPPVLLTVEPRPAPDTVLPRLEGGETTLAEWKGRGIVLNFWATWCFPCREEMPALVDFSNEHQDIVVVGVNDREDADTARAFVEEYAISFPILLDERGVMGNRLGVVGLPTTVFIGPDGKLMGRHVGQLDGEILEAWVPALRGEAEAPAP